jgi:hypothetical protein
LEEPAPAKGASKTKDAADKTAAPRAPLLPQLPALSGKQLGILAAAAAIVAAIWWGISSYESVPDQGDVLAMLADSNPQTRINGIYIMGGLELDPKEKATHLLKVLKEDRVDDVRVAAVNALVNNGVSPDQATVDLKPMLATEQNASVKAMLEWLISQSAKR